MTVNAALFEAIREKFRDEVATPNSLAWENDNEPTQTITQKRYRLKIQFDSDAEQLHSGAAGAARHRKTGSAMVDLLGPVGDGDGDLLVVADAIETAFLRSGITALNVCFLAPTLLGGGELIENRYQLTMSLPFTVDYFG